MEISALLNKQVHSKGLIAMRKIFSILCVLSFVCGCVQKVSYQEIRLASFSKTDTEGQIVFIGDSLTNLMPPDLFGSTYANRGVGGYKTSNILDAYDRIIQGVPRTLFIMAGINDLNSSVPVDTIIDNYKRILDKVHPETKVYIQSVLPARDAALKNEIIVLNKRLRLLASERGIIYINLHPYFTDNGGILDEKYTAPDGMHLSREGYEVWKKIVLPYIK